MRPGRDADPSPSSSAEVKNRVELYLYSLKALSHKTFDFCWINRSFIQMRNFEIDSILDNPIICYQKNPKSEKGSVVLLAIQLI